MLTTRAEHIFMSISCVATNIISANDSNWSQDENWNSKMPVITHSLTARCLFVATSFNPPGAIFKQSSKNWQSPKVFPYSKEIRSQETVLSLWELYAACCAYISKIINHRNRQTWRVCCNWFLHVKSKLRIRFAYLGFIIFDTYTYHNIIYPWFEKYLW